MKPNNFTILFFIILFQFAFSNLFAAKVTLLTPQNNTGEVTLTPTFTWHSEGQGTLQNSLYIDSDPNPFDGGTAYDVGETQSYTLATPLIVGTIYYWGVQVTDDNGSLQSVVYTFTPLNSDQGGQFGSEKIITTTANGACSVHAVDIDGDGDMDVLSASEYDHKIAWYENNGSGIFIIHSISTAADGAFSVYAADVDGDGDMDVLSASEYDNKIAWYENNGSGSFTANTITTNADSASSVYADDVDGDGDVDVLSASYSDDKIAWYENDGNEAFTAHTITTTADGARSVYAADMDGDGDVDVLSASEEDDKIAWYENNGSETFTAHIIITPNLLEPKSVYAADVDGDGDMDVLSAASSWWPAVNIAWYENDGSEAFTAHTITTTADGAYSVYAADMDGDGDMDVLSASENDDKIAWYENDGNGAFTAHTITTTSYNAYSVYAADMDGDGDMDVLSASAGDDKIAWYENTTPPPITQNIILLTPQNNTGEANLTPTFTWHSEGQGTLQHMLYIDTDPNPFDGGTVYDASTAQSFTLADPLIAGTLYYWGVEVTDDNGSQQSVVYTFTPLNSSQGGQFGVQQIISTNANGAKSVYAADMDWDGDMDVLSASEEDDKIAWYENNGSGSFTAHTITTTADGAHSVYAADVDGDGDMDVLSASYFDDKIAWYENDGSEIFISHTITTNADGARSVYAADVDGDGDMDVLSASYLANKIAWYENDGNEAFTAHTITTTADNAYSVYAADVDGDGDMDVLSASSFEWSGVKIAWYENNGNEVFTAHTITTDAKLAYSVYAVDVDGDGYMDVLSASGGDDKIAWYENNGSGAFTAHTITTTADGAHSVYAADADGDGDMDVLSASHGDGKIAWYENNGSETFIAHTITTDAKLVNSVYAADMDGDGDMDVLSASHWDNKIAWYENTTPQTAFVSLNTPQNGATAVELRPNMSWSSTGEGSLNHIIYIGTTPDPFTNGTPFSIGNVQNYMPTADLSPSRPYYWGVEVSDSNSAMQSPVRSFTTMNLNIDVTHDINLSAYTGMPTNPRRDVSTDYRMFSLPCNLDNVKINSISKTPLRVSDIITNGTSGTDWSMYRDNGSASNFFEKLSTFSSLTRTGEGYWIWKQGALTLPPISSSYTLDTNQCVEIVLTPNSWNIIGNPFDEAVSWQNVLTINNITGDIWDYDGSFNQSTQLAPYKGYYFYESSGKSTLKIPYPGVSTSALSLKTSLSENRTFNWRIQILLQTSMNEDNANYIATSPSANIGLDYLDSYKPPMFEDQGYVVFERPVWNSRYSKFSSDIKPEFEEGEIWEFVVHNPSGKATLSFNFEDVPEAYQVALIDSLNSNPVEITHQSEYEFYSTLKRHSFKLLVGSDEFLAENIGQSLPNDFSLLQNYPNPFNPVTTIGYHLKETALVQIYVYNILGQKVKTLVNQEQSAGTYHATFDGTNLSSGMYFYRLMANGIPVKVRKMSLVK